MDVTAENFWQLLPNMLEAIAAADYVAVDLEMSGVMVRDSLTTGEVSFEQAYARLRSAANTFSAIELGITTMRFVECMSCPFPFLFLSLAFVWLTDPANSVVPDPDLHHSHLGHNPQTYKGGRAAGEASRP